MKFAACVVVIGIGLTAGPKAGVCAEGLDTRMMLATLKISGPETGGTGFVLSRAEPDDPKREELILVTAEHVLGQAKGDEVTVLYHRREPDGGYARSPAKVTIRRGGKALWTKHPEADLAVMPVTPPADTCVPHLSVGLLASDADLERYEVHPGDLIRCVGFPHPLQFDPRPEGFGLVRSGCIATFPLLPTRKTKTFLFDFNTFEGDSGGPVYLAEPGRVYGGKPEPRPVELILGLATAQHFIDEEFKIIYQTGKFRHRMGLSIVVHASAIREAIDRLPPPDAE